MKASLHVKLVTKSSKIFKSLLLWGISRRCCFADLKDLKQVPLEVMIQICLLLPPLTHLYIQSWGNFSSDFQPSERKAALRLSMSSFFILLVIMNWRALDRLFNFNPEGVMITWQVNQDLFKKYLLGFWPLPNGGRGGRLLDLSIKRYIKRLYNMYIMWWWYSTF